MSYDKQQTERGYMQYAAVLSASLSSLSSSVYFVWTSPTLPLLQSENTPLRTPINHEEASWLVSSYLLASCIGAGIAGWLVEYAGRKVPLLLSSALLLAPWIIIIFAKHIYILILARIIGGIGNGISVIGCSLYNAEIVDKDIRGKLGTAFVGLKLFGSLVVLAVGPYVSYTTLAVICGLFPIVFAATFVFMPESPYYLTKVGDFVGAKRTLKILMGNGVNENVLDRLSLDLRNCVESDIESKPTVREFLSSNTYRKPLIIMLGIKSLHHLSGVPAIEAYLQPIIEKTDSIISPEISSIIFGVVQMLSVFVASFLVDKVGRKPLLVLSAVGCGVSLCGEGAYFYIHDTTTNSTEGIKWLPTTGIAIFMVMGAIGIGSVPYVLLGELFPTNIKGIAISISTMYATMLAFAVSKSFDPISRALGLHTIFWIYATNCALGAVFVVFLLPETKGATFADIQDKVNGKGQKGTYRFVV